MIEEIFALNEIVPNKVVIEEIIQQFENSLSDLQICSFE
jgi:hypothetical protein